MPHQTDLDHTVERTPGEISGVHPLRPGQHEVIQSALEGRDTLAIVPTGAVKSLCDQIAGLGRSGTTVVVSPLIAPPKDQMVSESEKSVRAQRSEFVLVSPERLASPSFRETLGGQHVDLLVVDEAHCVSEWGHDFRPAYLRIGEVARSLGRPPLLALTATAPPRIMEDIVQQLGMRDVVVINTGTRRDNLEYEVMQAANEGEKLRHLLRLLEVIEGQGLVYCSTLANVEQVSSALAGARVLPYHGRLTPSVRADHQQRFMGGEARVMVATNAFGIGLDKPDVRFVIHYDLTPSIEAYYQESGRAGRDGAPARCILIHRPEDWRVPLFFLSRHYLRAEDVRRVCEALGHGRPVQWKHLRNDLDRGRTKAEVAIRLLCENGWMEESPEGVLRLLARPDDETIDALAERFIARRVQDRTRLDAMVAYANTRRCRWQVMLEHFGDPEGAEPCGTCDNCRASGRRQADAGDKLATSKSPHQA